MQNLQTLNYIGNGDGLVSTQTVTLYAADLQGMVDLNASFQNDKITARTLRIANTSTSCNICVTVNGVTAVVPPYYDGYFDVSQADNAVLCASSATTFELQVMNYPVNYGVFTRGDSNIARVGLGEYANVFGEGVNYRAATSWVLRSSFPELSNLFPNLSDTVLTNAIGWLPTVGGAAGYWRGCCYGNGLFVAVDFNNVTGSDAVAVSPNGKNWTLYSLGTTEAWRNVAYGNGVFVASAGTLGGFGTSVYSRSTDGVNWTPMALPVLGNWNSVCFAGGYFFILDYGTVNGYRSADGVTWTAITFPAAASILRVVYGNSRWVAVDNVTLKAYYSLDGLSWTMVNTTMANPCRALAFANGVFVIIDKSAASFTSYRTSTDGASWSGGVLTTDLNCFDVQYRNGAFLAIFNASATLLTSENGTSWATRAIASANDWLNLVFSDDGEFFSITGGVTPCIHGHFESSQNNFIYLAGTVGQFVRVL